jgi:hypothetical protein
MAAIRRSVLVNARHVQILGHHKLERFTNQRSQLVVMHGQLASYPARYTNVGAVGSRCQDLPRSGQPTRRSPHRHVTIVVVVLYKRGEQIPRTRASCAP